VRGPSLQYRSPGPRCPRPGCVTGARRGPGPVYPGSGGQFLPPCPDRATSPAPPPGTVLRTTADRHHAQAPPPGQLFYDRPHLLSPPRWLIATSSASLSAPGSRVFRWASARITLSFSLIGLLERRGVPRAEFNFAGLSLVSGSSPHRRTYLSSSVARSHFLLASAPAAPRAGQARPEDLPALVP